MTVNFHNPQYEYHYNHIITLPSLSSKLSKDHPETLRTFPNQPLPLGSRRIIDSIVITPECKVTDRSFPSGTAQEKAAAALPPSRPVIFSWASGNPRGWSEEKKNRGEKEGERG